MTDIFEPCAPSASVETRQLRSDGIYRVKEIVKPHGFFPISKSTWYAGVREGRYPSPVKLGPKLSGWRGKDLLDLLEQGVA